MNIKNEMQQIEKFYNNSKRPVCRLSGIRDLKKGTDAYKLEEFTIYCILENGGSVRLSTLVEEFEWESQNKDPEASFKPWTLKTIEDADKYFNSRK